MVIQGEMGNLAADSTTRLVRALALATACAALAGCASSDKFAKRVDPKYGVSTSPRVVDFSEPIPKGGGAYRVGKPYIVGGRTYVPEEDTNYRAEGMASWYGDDFHGRLTANGEVFDMTSLTAAHPTMPLPSYARVTNLANGKSVIVRVNDRGPYHGNRVIDVSHSAANALDFRASGVARVQVDYVGRAPLEGSDDRQLMATLRTGEPAPAPTGVRVASARPFIPEMSSPRAALRGDIPMPAERPYTLGNTSNDRVSSSAASENSTSRSSRLAAAREPHLIAANRKEAEAADSSEVLRPVSAYAPASSGGRSNLLSGRGLY